MQRGWATLPRSSAESRSTPLRRVRLKEIDDNLAKRDGARSSTETKAYWSKQGFRADDELWLMEFELVS
ncbi:MAG TPA: hypothetical protein VLY82_00510 [Nitrososphaerales archaeon]|nr:hypothetical protein [Nitrososphaerales archaeon]